MPLEAFFANIGVATYPVLPLQKNGAKCILIADNQVDVI